MEKTLLEVNEPILNSQEDVSEITQLVKDAVKYQNDPQPFLDLHSEEAVVVNFVGRRVLGRDALAAAMGQALSSPLANVITENIIEDIRFIRPDVALVSCVKHVKDERTFTDGHQKNLTGSKGALTYLLLKGKNGWRISLAQTTPIVAV